MGNADVVCRQLGCGHAVAAPSSAHFGRGSGPIWLDNVECSGVEVALTHCRHPGFGENNCGHGEDASAICLGKMPGSFSIYEVMHFSYQTHCNPFFLSSVLGALAKPQISVSPSPEASWGDRVEFTCTVVTEHLGGTFFLKKTQGPFKMVKYSENEAATFVFQRVDFDQKGSYYCEYQKKLSNQVINYPQGNTADLTVSGWSLCALLNKIEWSTV